LNLFSIAVTSGELQLPLSPEDRFLSFAIHAAIFWVLFVAREAGSRHKNLLWARCIVVGACLTGAHIYFAHGQRLSADGPHYFVQARSFLFDRDVDFENDYARVRAPKPIAERYPLGSALLSIPFLLTAHVLLFLGNLEASGFGYAYETAFGLAGYFFASWALLAVLETVARLFSTAVSVLALSTVTASSFLAWYMLVEPSMPHAMSFAWTSLFLCYWLEHRPFSGWRPYLVLGVLAGVAALVRWQNGALVLLPLLDQIIDSPRSYWKAAATLATFALCMTPQLLFLHAMERSPLTLAAEGHGVSWSQLGVLEVLYSTNRGLFPWNPVVYLSILGLIGWVRESRRLALLFLGGFLLELYVNASVGIWWAGWSFGGRRFDSSVLFFVVGTAALFEFLRRRPAILVSAFALTLVLWTYGLMIQARRGEIPPDRLVSFRSVALQNVRSFYDAFGFPFAWPANWIFAHRHEVPPEKFDRLFGHEGFGNFRIAFDADAEPYLGRGWGAAEMDPAGRWFRWTVGGASTVLVPLKSPRQYELEVEAGPYEAVSPNRVFVSINGSVEHGQDLTELSLLRWQVARSKWHRGLNTIRFEPERTARTGPTDGRELGAAFYRMSLVALPDGF
jgi:hypothetical protein